jgi:hypothetical protein
VKNLATALLFAYLLCVAACSYDVPLAENQRLPLDPRLIGTWKATVTESFGEVTIGKYSPTEYSLRLSQDAFGSKFMRGYPINVDGVALIQLRLTDEHFNPQTGDGKYFVISTDVESGTLIIKSLNLSASGNRTSSADLKALFLREKRDGKLSEDFVSVDRFAKKAPVLSAAPAAPGRRTGRASRKATAPSTKTRPAAVVATNNTPPKIELTPNSFKTKNLNLETAITGLYLGDFAHIRMESDSIEFGTLFGSYLNTYARRCESFLPANRVEMTRQECATERVTRNGYGVEISRTCVEYREVGTGLYADPDLYAAQRRVDANATRKLLSGSLMDLMNNAVGTAMRGIDATTAAGRDMDSLLEMNSCSSPALKRFQENMRRFAVGETPLLLAGSETLASVRTTPSPSNFKDGNYAKLIDDLITDNSQGWMMNRYVRGSVSDAAVASRDQSGRPWRLRADYLFDGFNGRAKGSVIVEFTDGLPHCLYFSDFPSTCRSASPRIVTAYENGRYQN